MAVNQLLTIIGILALFAMINYGRAAYWKGKFESLDLERPDGESSGWRNEVMFLRRLVNKDVAEAAEKAAEEHF